MNLFDKAKLTSNVKPLCLCCNKTYQPDQRNVNRGWGLFCSKSCSVTYRNKLSMMSKSDRKVEMRNKVLKQLGI